MELKEPVRCIHTDPKTKKTTVKFLMPHVVERLRKYGWRVEHVAKPVEKAVKEANASIPENVPDVTGIVQGEMETLPEIPSVEFIDTPEPVTAEQPKPKRKYATGQPKKVTNK